MADVNPLTPTVAIQAQL